MSGLFYFTPKNLKTNQMTNLKEEKKTINKEVGGIHAIPELARQWQKLNLAKIIKRNAAFVSISQNKCLYDKEGALGHENHRSRGSLPTTIRTVKAARKSDNFISFNWVGYNIYRDDYPQTIFDRVKYDSWTEGLEVTEEKKKW